MAEAATIEFWRDIKPIERVFRADALPETWIPDAATDDDLHYFPMSETVFSRPLWISPQRNMWADILMAKAAGLVNRHYHPHQVFAYTIQGKWGYLEHGWTATAGDFVYESPGEGHTLVAYETPEPTKIFFIVTGPLIWLDANGDSIGHYDVHDYIADARAHYDKVGLGAARVDALFR